MLAAETQRVRLVEASAEELPFEDALVRRADRRLPAPLSDDLPAGLRELARVLRPGATAALLDFGVPPGPVPRVAWDLWVDVGLPLAGRAISPGWHEVGRFLGGSIRDFDERWPRAAAADRDARGRLRGRAGADASASAAASSSGAGARDRGAAGVLRARAGRLARLRHAAAPAVHGLAPELRRDRRLPRAALCTRAGSRPRWLAFFLALGISAHALDELNGRPLQTQIPERVLVALTIVPLAGAVGDRDRRRISFDRWLLVFVAAGLALVPVYNLELFGGAIHNDAGFALAWGAFPLLTGYFACAGTITWTALLAAAYATLTSYVQRVLSTPVRHLRRRVAAVGGTIELRDGEPRAGHARDADGRARARAQGARGRDRRPRGRAAGAQAGVACRACARRSSSSSSRGRSWWSSPRPSPPFSTASPGRRRSALATFLGAAAAVAWVAFALKPSREVRRRRRRDHGLRGAPAGRRRSPAPGRAGPPGRPQARRGGSPLRHARLGRGRRPRRRARAHTLARPRRLALEARRARSARSARRAARPSPSGSTPPARS